MANLECHCIQFAVCLSHRSGYGSWSTRTGQRGFSVAKRGLWFLLATSWLVNYWYTQHLTQLRRAIATVGLLFLCLKLIWSISFKASELIQLLTEQDGKKLCRTVPTSLLMISKSQWNINPFSPFSRFISSFEVLSFIVENLYLIGQEMRCG